MGLTWQLKDGDIILIELIELNLTIPVRIEEVGRDGLMFSIEPFGIRFRVGEVRGSRAEVAIIAPRSKVGICVGHDAA